MSREYDATIVCQPWSDRVHGSGKYPITATRERCSQCGQIVAVAPSTQQYMASHSVKLICIKCGFDDPALLKRTKEAGPQMLKTELMAEEVMKASGKTLEEAHEWLAQRMKEEGII